MPQQPPSISCTSAPGSAAQQLDAALRADHGLLVAVAVEDDRGGPRPPSADRARATRRRSPRRAGRRRGAPGGRPPRRAGRRAAGRRTRRAASAGTTARSRRSARRARRPARGARPARARERARPRRGPWTGSPGRSSRAPPAARRQPARSSSSTHARPIAGSVNVVKESARNTASPRGNGPAAPRLRAYQRISDSRSKRGSGALRRDAERATPAAPAGRPAQVRQRRGGRAEPVERADRAERARAQRRPVDRRGGAASASVFSVAMSTLSGHSLLHALHVEAEVEDLVQALVAERGVRVGLATARSRARSARPRVECSSSRVAM